MRSTKKKPDNVIDISGNVELVMKLAADKLDAGDHIGALSLIRRAETIEPENEEVMLAIAGTYNEMNRFTESLAYSSCVLNSGHEYVQDAFMIAGYSYLGLGEYVAARKAYRQFLINVPDSYTDEDLIAVYEALDICEANCALNESRESVPAVRDSSEVELEETLKRIEAEEDRVNGDMAYGLLSDAIEKFPDSYELFEKYLLSCYAVMHFKKGIKKYEAAPEKWKSRLTIRCYAALLYSGAHRPRKAAECADNILKMKGLDEEELMRASAVMLEIQNASAAMTLVKRVYSEHPYDQLVIHNYALSAYLSGDYALARTLFEKQLRIDPSDSVAAYYRKLCIKTQEDGILRNVCIPYDVPSGELFRCMTVLSNELGNEDAGRMLTESEPELTQEEIEECVRYCAEKTPPPFRIGGLMLLYERDRRSAMHELYKILLDPSCDDSVRRFAIMTFRDKENMTRFTIFDKGKLLTGELFSTENQPDKTDDEEKENDCPHLQAPFGRLNALLQQKLCNCSKKIRQEAENIVEAAAELYNDLGLALSNSQVPAYAAAIDYTCRFMNSKRAVNAKKLIKDYDITLRRLENAAEKLQSDLCVYGMFEPEEMCKLEDSFEETFKKLHEEEKAAAERKKAGKTKPSSCKNADTGSNKAALASKKRTNSGRKSDKEAKDDSVNNSESGSENNGGAPDAE